MLELLLRIPKKIDHVIAVAPNNPSGIYYGGPETIKHHKMLNAVITKDRETTL